MEHCKDLAAKSEELKVVKQRRLGQEITDTTNVLPLRIRIFEWFKSQPRVLNMDHVEYNVPKIRLNFVTKLRSRKVNASYFSAGHLAW